MRHKQFVITRLEAQQNLLENLLKALDSNTINKPDALVMLAGVIKNLDLVAERLGLESDE